MKKTDNYQQTLKEQYDAIWKCLKRDGYNHGDDITHFEFVQACEESHVDPDKIDVDEFCFNYNIEIG